MHLLLLGAANSIHCVKIANGLVARGNQVSFVSLPAHAGGDDALDERVEKIFLPHNSYIFQGRALQAIFSRTGADLVYAHYASGYGTLLRTSAIHPSVLAIWGSDIYAFPKKSPFHRLLIQKNLAFADGLFSTSKLMAQEARKYTKKSFVITPFGVDTKRFFPEAGREEAFLRHVQRDKRISIGFIKSLEKVYGLEYLIQALALLKADRTFQALGIQPRLDIYGDGSLGPALRKLARSLGVRKDLVFHGRIPNRQVPQALAAMDIFCAPSIQESFGVSEVEAMACGVISVTSDADGFREVTEEGKFAYLVEGKKPQAIQEAILHILTHPKEALDRAKAARAHAQALYDWEKNIETIESELKKCLKF